MYNEAVGDWHKWLSIERDDMLEDFIYKVDDLRLDDLGSHDLATSVVEVDVDVSWTTDRNKLKALFSRVEIYINEDLVESRKVEDAIEALNLAFTCQKLEDKQELKNIIRYYELHARSLGYLEQADERVYIAECRREGQKIFSVYIGIDTTDVWGFIPVNDEYTQANIKTVQAHIRELLSIMGVTTNEYKHLDFLVARYLVLLDDFIG